MQIFNNLEYIWIMKIKEFFIQTLGRRKIFHFCTHLQNIDRNNNCIFKVASTFNAVLRTIGCYKINYWQIYIILTSGKLQALFCTSFRRIKQHYLLVSRSSYVIEIVGNYEYNNEELTFKNDLYFHYIIAIEFQIIIEQILFLVVEY